MSADLDHERLAVLVHEVRSPVAALTAVAEALSEPPTDSALRAELVRLALAACGAIDRIVRDLTVTSLHLEVVDMRSLVSEVGAAFRLRGADVVLEVEPGELAVRGDAVRLRQALDNVVGNAVVHGARGGPVRVSARAAGDHVVVRVADSGVGIATTDLERIFEPGVRLDSRSPGSGLGLALARSIVEAHGGAVMVESKVGAGTTFVLSLPVPSA